MIVLEIFPCQYMNLSLKKNQLHGMECMCHDALHNLLVSIFWVHNRPLDVEKGLVYVCYEVIRLVSPRTRGSPGLSCFCVPEVCGSASLGLRFPFVFVKLLFIGV